VNPSGIACGEGFVGERLPLRCTTRGGDGADLEMKKEVVEAWVEVLAQSNGLRIYST
jgi:hypothetical protein